MAGGLVASQAAALVGQQRLAEVMLGFGVVSWIVVGSLILGRLFFHPLLPTALQPTMAIEVAPAAVAGQVTLKGDDNMTGLGTPDGQAFIQALRATEK